jgi:hypothetical protein
VRRCEKGQALRHYLLCDQSLRLRPGLTTPNNDGLFRCIAIELNPAYIDVNVKRWEQFTGETATLETDGRTFAEIAAARHQEAA